MTDGSWEYLDRMPSDELPPMPAGVDMALREWCSREHGLHYGRHYVGHFLDLLAAEGYTVERSVVASARSYTTIEQAQIDRTQPDPNELTEGRIRAEDPTWHHGSDEEPPVRSIL